MNKMERRMGTAGAQISAGFSRGIVGKPIPKSMTSRSRKSRPKRSPSHVKYLPGNYSNLP